MPGFTSRRPRVRPARSDGRGSRELPSLTDRLADPRTSWRRVIVQGWYARTERRLDLASGIAVWHHPGMRVTIRWGLVREGDKPPQAFLCTNPEADPETILAWLVRRWRVEVTLEEARRHLGMETQRQWSELAILRTPPSLLGLFSLVTLWADWIRTERNLVLNSARWYPKAGPTVSDALALVRRELWTAPTFETSRRHRHITKPTANLLDRLILVACHPP